MTNVDEFDLIRQITTEYYNMKYLKIEDVCKMFGISRRTLERMRNNGQQNTTSVIGDNDSKLSKLIGEILPLKFPEPDLFIGRSPRWEETKLISWLEKNGKRLSNSN